MSFINTPCQKDCALTIKDEIKRTVQNLNTLSVVRAAEDLPTDDEFIGALNGAIRFLENLRSQIS